MSKLYQMGSYGALLSSNYQGVGTVGELLLHGAFGIGTLDGASGETIVANGICYQARADGSVRVVPKNATTPFSVSYDRPSMRLSALTELDKTKSWALLISGTFDTLTLSVKPSNNTAPYAELALATFEKENLSGVLTGIFTPDAGFHLHFLSDDHAVSGHVAAYRPKKVEIWGEIITETETFSF
ncbi:MAG: acetolactate decarboxylase [Streptococcaceae bacterium]|jgi:acetolactate decarboxylase|nr:acetolactate decarboxylase [Streptococcaceae bacterium]